MCENLLWLIETNDAILCEQSSNEVPTLETLEEFGTCSLFRSVPGKYRIVKVLIILPPVITLTQTYLALIRIQPSLRHTRIKGENVFPIFKRPAAFLTQPNGFPIMHLPFENHAAREIAGLTKVSAALLERRGESCPMKFHPCPRPLRAHYRFLQCYKGFRLLT